MLSLSLWVGWSDVVFMRPFVIKGNCFMLHLQCWFVFLTCFCWLLFGIIKLLHCRQWILSNFFMNKFNEYLFLRAKGMILGFPEKIRFLENGSAFLKTNLTSCCERSNASTVWIWAWLVRARLRKCLFSLKILFKVPLKFSLNEFHLKLQHSNYV